MVRFQEGTVGGARTNVRTGRFGNATGSAEMISERSKVSEGGEWRSAAPRPAVPGTCGGAA